MADPVPMFSTIFYVGVLIANPPIVGGTKLVPSGNDASIVYVFTQPATPCDAVKCEQEILRIEKNSDSCWVWDDISLDNVDLVPGFFFVPADTDRMLTFGSLGNVNGRRFVFRARVTSRCGPTS